MAPSRIAAALQMAPSTLSNLLKAMTDAGLIERAQRADDLRRVDGAISSLARELMETYDATSLRTIENFLDDLADHEQAAFEAAVPILRRKCATFATTPEHVANHD